MLVSAVLRRDGLSPTIAESGEEAIEKLRGGSYRAVLLDLMLREHEGLEVLRYLKNERPEMLRRVVLVTTAPDQALRRLTERDEIWDVVRKPFDIDHLLRVVRACRAQSG